MRQLKFRAWFKTLDEMVFDDILFTKRLLKCSCADGGIHENADTCIGFAEDYEQKYCDIMQYTGIKDKKQTEIYEGDIVKFLYGGFEENIGTVIYDTGDFVPGFCIEWGDGNIEESFANAEIVGNIFENPELVK